MLRRIENWVHIGKVKAPFRSNGKGKLELYRRWAIVHTLSDFGIGRKDLLIQLNPSPIVIPPRIVYMVGCSHFLTLAHEFRHLFRDPERGHAFGFH